MPVTQAAGRTARELWSRATQSINADEPEAMAIAADRLLSQLRHGLGRWVGAEGYRALLTRSLGLVRPEHMALEGLSCLGEDVSAMFTALRTHGLADVSADLTALIAVIIELLGRIVGDEMALRLVEQTGSPSTRTLAGRRSKGARDG